MTNLINGLRWSLDNAAGTTLENDDIKSILDHIDAQAAKIKALVKALEVFAKHADKRKRKSIEGSVCFSQPLLIAAREALAAAKELT